MENFTLPIEDLKFLSPINLEHSQTDLNSCKLNELEYVFLDTETTTENEDFKKSELIEASAMFMNYKGVEKFNPDIVFDKLNNFNCPTPENPIVSNDNGITFLCKPKSSITPESSAIHNITNKDVADFPNCEELLSYFCDKVNNKILVIHNASFDYDVIKNQSEKLYGENRFKPLVVIDTLYLSRALLPERKSHKLQVLKYLFDLDCSIAHRSLSDCATLLLVFNSLLRIYINKGYQNDLGSLLNLISNEIFKPIETVNFGKHSGQLLKDVPTDYLDWWATNKTNMEDITLTDYSFLNELNKRMPNEYEHFYKRVFESYSNKIQWPMRIA